MIRLIYVLESKELRNILRIFSEFENHVDMESFWKEKNYVEQICQIPAR